ncbi:hypothetical protein Cgig2_024302 [Carnegiea gigantea]|uniref:Pentatricopeptide repeat-containing protein n=1 Tax=Carnegiea gigantea TaxID=171969 RepID=A0A9Q1GPI8_9CARY|nr:hypothetical protein Cgig2_024302 [Carnegiea gigantea]
MWVSAVRSVSRRNFCKNPQFIRQGSVLTLAQLNSGSTDSSSDQQTISAPNNSDLEDPFSELDSKRVADILHDLRRDPKHAFTFFIELKERGFRHNVETYVSIVRILCNRGCARMLETLLLAVIESKEDDLGFDIFELLEAVSEILEVEGTSLLGRLFDALVKTYASLGMFDEAIDVLFQTQRKGFFPCVFSCNFLLNCLVNRNKLDMAVAVYQQIKRLGFTPNVYSCNLVMKAFCKKGCLEEAVDVFREMEEAGINPNEYSYTTYIEGLCTHQKTELGYEVLKAWRNSSVPFDNYAYDVVIRGFCNEMKLNEAEGVLLDIESQGLNPSVFCFGSLIHAYCKARNILKALSRQSDMNSKDAMCKLGKVEEAVKLLEEMKHRNMVPDLIHYSTLINGYCLEGKLLDACNVFEEVKAKGFEPDVITYNILVSGFARYGLVGDALNLLDHMMAQGLAPDISMQNKIIEGLCLAGKVEEAEDFLKNLKEKHPDNYSAMINGYCEARHASKAYALFVKLSQRGLLVKKKTCMKLLDSLCMEGETKSAFMLFETLLALEDAPCIIMCSKFLAALCKVGQTKRARRVFDIWVGKGLTPDATMYTIMINGYSKKNSILKALKLFDDMKDRGITADVITYTVLLDGCLNWSLKKSRLHSDISYIKQAGMVESEIRSEMLEMDKKPDVVCYPVLIEKSGKLNGVQDAIKLFNEVMDSGMQPDTVMYTVLLSGYFRVGDVDGALTLLDTMSSQGLQPDQVTLSVLERGILKSGKISLRS